MEFVPGDYVRFVNEKQEGTVTRIISAGIIGVTIEQDFEIPVSASEIVLVNRAERELRDKKEQPDILSQGRKHVTETAVEDLNALGLFIAFTEDKALKYLLHRHLINTSDFEVFISLYLESGNHFSCEWSGRVNAGASIQIPAVSLKEVENWPIFHFQILYLRKGNFKPQEPREHFLKLRSKHFSLSRKALPLLTETGYIFSLDPAPLEIDPVKLREHFFTKNENSSISQPRPADEVDLHLEALPDFNRNLPPTEALKLQLDYFQKNLDAALTHNMDRIVFIHGVGNGVLRHEIHKRISSHAYVRTWKDAGKDRFGYGATEVFLK